MQIHGVVFPCSLLNDTYLTYCIFFRRSELFPQISKPSDTVNVRLSCQASRPCASSVFHPFHPLSFNSSSSSDTNLLCDGLSLQRGNNLSKYI